MQGGAAVPVIGAKGEEAFESSDRKFVYYAKLDAPGIWRVLVAGGEETRILDQARESLWALTGQGICYFDLTNPVAPALKFYSFPTGKSRLLRQFPKGTSVDTLSTALSVSPDGRWILYTQLDQAGSDLMMVENFR